MSLLVEAITHPSYIHKPQRYDAEDVTAKDALMMSTSKDYQRLEFLGDAIIEYVVMTYAFVQFPDWAPQQLTDWKTQTVSNRALGMVAITTFHIHTIIRHCMPLLQQNIDEYFRRHRRVGAVDLRDEDGDDDWDPPKVFADVFEALVAAVFIDCGYHLQTVANVFLTPLLHSIGEDAVKFVESKMSSSGREKLDNGNDN